MRELELACAGLIWIKNNFPYRVIFFIKMGGSAMKARDVMVSPVITVKPNSSIREAAQTLLEKRVSAVPVVGEDGELIGMLSEGDLMHRAEAGTERRHSWWLRLMAGEDTPAAEYVKAHGRKVADVMTRYVITATPDTPLDEIATLLEKNAIKRVPIVEDGQLIGIVSRANLVQAVASAPNEPEASVSDTAIRDKLLAHLTSQPWAHTELLNVMVNAGVVDLWGFVGSETESKAISIAAEATPGVRAVNNNLSLWLRGYGV